MVSLRRRLDRAYKARKHEEEWRRYWVDKPLDQWTNAELDRAIAFFEQDNSTERPGLRRRLAAMTDEQLEAIVAPRGES